MKTDRVTRVLTYYDPRAAFTVGAVWGKTAIQPDITTDATQFSEGSIVVKAVMTSASGDDWPVIEGAAPWPVYFAAEKAANSTPQPLLTTIHLFQFDIIVKDTAAAPGASQTQRGNLCGRHRKHDSLSHSEVITRSSSM